jgi:hypothetical protein
VRLFLAVLLVALAFPGLAAAYGAIHGAGAGGVLAWSSQHLPLVWAGAAATALVDLVALERPRSLSARAYAAQLRDRFRGVHGEFERAVEAALRDRNMSEFNAAPAEPAGAAPERLDGLDAADNTRR